MNRPLRAVVIVIAVLALFGCSSSDDEGATDADSDTTTSVAADVAPTTELGQACVAGNAAITTASADIVAGLDALKEASSREEYEAALTEVQTGADAAVTAVEDFKTSVASLDGTEDLIAALDAQIAVAEDVVAAAASDSASSETLAALNEALADVQDAGAEAAEARTTAADALGEPACAPEAVGGDDAGGGGGGGGAGGATTTTEAA